VDLGDIVENKNALATTWRLLSVSSCSSFDIDQVVLFQAIRSFLSELKVTLLEDVTMYIPVLSRSRSD
jgi:hypothetical protein